MRTTHGPTSNTGAERAQTHFWRTHATNGFHVDFVFIPAAWVGKLRSLEIGSHADWVAAGHSDHVPITVDLDLEL